jgi:hypothetical protein
VALRYELTTGGRVERMGETMPGFWE